MIRIEYTSLPSISILLECFPRILRQAPSLFLSITFTPEYFSLLSHWIAFWHCRLFRLAYGASSGQLIQAWPFSFPSALCAHFRFVHQYQEIRSILPFVFSLFFFSVRRCYFFSSVDQYQALGIIVTSLLSEYWPAGIVGITSSVGF